MAKKESREFRVENILLAAVDEFVQKGYDGASIDKIASKAGVSKGGFYYHFATKESLLMEVNNKLNGPVYETARKAMANEDPMEGLKQYICFYLTYWTSRPKELSFSFLSMAKSLESPVLSDYFKQYIDESTIFFSHMLEKIKHNKKQSSKNINLSAISLMGALDGMISYLIVHPETNIELIASQLLTMWI